MGKGRRNREKRAKKQRPGGPRVDLPSNPLMGFLDHEAKQRIVVSGDVLINQLRRDAPKIEASFDAACDEEIREISELFSLTVGVLIASLRLASRQNDELRLAAGPLLSNASNSLAAAAAVLRAGYVLQPGILIRSLLETVSTVLHLIQVPGGLGELRSGRLKSTRTLAAAKTALPPIGALYGYFSENFAHIGDLHKGLPRVGEFERGDEALEVNLGFLRIGTWLLYTTTELLYFDLVPQPRYWVSASGGFTFDPSDDERKWMDSFFRFKEEISAE